MKSSILELCRDPFTMFLVASKAESNEPDLIRLLTDEDYLVSERDKRLQAARAENLAVEIGNADGAIFIELLTDEAWRERNPLPGTIAQLSYRLGNLITEDQHMKALLGDGEELLTLKEMFDGATKKLTELVDEGTI
ncbi:hypothetical protein pEaSNUABM29_00183 [Erwinia phage pEa_SNUABM_29]|nr:hypothetical protein pEaSNUABM29_00183 [Erwinia phage pEa_SNUABM_29]